MTRAIAIVLVFVSFISPLPSRAAEPRFLDYLYMEPNEGGSSAGHVAVALGDRTYAFQRSDDGLLVLERDDSAHVGFLYAALGNRAVHRSRIAVTDDVYERMREAFNRRFLIQQRHLALRDGLEADRRLLHGLLGSGGARADGVLVPAAGYFVRADGDEAGVLTALRDAIGAAHGKGFLGERLAALHARLGDVQPRARDLPPATLAPDTYPDAGDSFAARYTAVASGIVALDLLRDGARLDPAAAVVVADAPLAGDERRALARAGDDLRARMTRLAGSPRSDFGAPLLIGMARLAAIEAALAANRLVVLDAFPEDGRRVRADVVARTPAAAEGFLADARDALARSRRAIAAAEHPTERDYVRLESAANRAVELDRAIAERRDVRLASGPLVPARTARYAVPPPRGERALLARALAATDGAADAYARALADLYRYDLLRRNCVTEAFRTIDDALGSDAEAALGGRIAADGGWRFVPKLADRAVTERWRVATRDVIPSHRQAEMRRLTSVGNPLLVRLRESNVLTSTLYRPSRDDSTFLFFTDDATPPLRPLLGAANLGVGLGASVLGIFRAPFDRGASLEAGLRGALWSVPELAFLNVRKGSYDYVRRPATAGAAAVPAPEPKLSMNRVR